MNPGISMNPALNEIRLIEECVVRRVGNAFLPTIKPVNLLNLLEAIMATITSDTLKFVRKLESAGFSIDQSRGGCGCFS
jgi:hypothetical protein